MSRLLLSLKHTRLRLVLLEAAGFFFYTLKDQGGEAKSKLGYLVCLLLP